MTETASVRLTGPDGTVVTIPDVPAVKLRSATGEELVQFSLGGSIDNGGIKKMTMPTELATDIAMSIAAGRRHDIETPARVNASPRAAASLTGVTRRTAAAYISESPAAAMALSQAACRSPRAGISASPTAAMTLTVMDYAQFQAEHGTQ